MDHQPLNRKKLNRHPREGEDCAGAEGGRLGAARGGHTLDCLASVGAQSCESFSGGVHPSVNQATQWVASDRNPGRHHLRWTRDKTPKKETTRTPPPPCAPHRPVRSRYVCSISGQPTPPSIRGRERLGRGVGVAPRWPAPPVPSLAACHGEDRGIPQPRHVRRAIGASRPGAGDRGGGTFPGPVFPMI